MVSLEEIRSFREKGMTWREIGVRLQETYGGEAYLWQERCRTRLRKSKKKGKLKNDNEVSAFVEKDDGQHRPLLDLDDTDSLLRQHGYDPKIWDVVESSCTLQGDRLNSRVKVKPRKIPGVDEDRLVESVGKALERVGSYVPSEERTTTCSPSLAILALFDVHYGRRSEFFDHHETERRVIASVDKVLDSIRGNQPDHIVIPIGQDLCNSDNVQGTTTKGTPQSTALEWHEMFAGALALMIAVIERCAEVAPVRVVYSKGNHDEMTSYAIVMALAQRYNSTWESNIEVETDAQPRQYIRWGQSLIGLSHGDEEVSLSTVMQVEARPMWGETEYHYWVTGHLHKLDISETNGVTVLRCPSLTFDDAWTTKKGYSSRRALALLTFDDDGLKEMCFATP